MEPSPESSSSPSLMPGEGARSQGQDSAGLRVNKALGKSTRQFFTNQHEHLAESEERSQAGPGHSVRDRSSLLRSFVIPSDDELSVTPADSQRTSTVDSSVPSDQKNDSPASNNRWLKSGPRSRHHFIPKMGRKSLTLAKRPAEAAREEEGQPQDEGKDEEEEENSWLPQHHGLQMFKPLEFLNSTKPHQRNLPPPIKFNTDTMTERFLGIDPESNGSTEEVKAKPKARIGESRRFSIYNKLSKIRGSKKEK
eukprot:g32575.t1